MMITSLHCEVHEASLLLSVRACFHIHLISKNLINKTTAKAALTQIISVTYQRMEIKDQELVRLGVLPAPDGSVPTPTATTAAPTAAAVPDAVPEAGGEAKKVAGESTTERAGGAGSPAPTGPTGVAMQFPSIFHKDAYLLFRALCKLSMKGLSEDTQFSQSDAIALQNK
jgi:brefeldin A-inhibited guanine nucleotide-exchange protein